MSNILQPLSVARINGIMMGLQDVRLIPQSLKFLQRTPITDATDNEIMGRFLGHIQIADVIADDSEAAVYSAGRMSFETTKIPNLKHGQALTQEQLNQLYSLMAAPIANGSLVGVGPNWEKGIISNLRLGVQQRMEALIIAAYTDTFTYDRLGIKITGTFGMPADLKITATIPWTDTANATPVDDVLIAKTVGSVRYGIQFNRLDMSTAAFRAMIATPNFQNRAKLYIPPQLAGNYNVFSLQSIEQQIPIAELTLGVTINLYDSRYWSQAPDGTLSSQPFLPINKVVLSDSRNDGNENVFDFGNAVTTESYVSSLTKTNMIGAFTQPMRGPIAYATSPADLNPPNITYWGVARGMARRRLLQGSAVLNVGNVIDPIPVGEPPLL